MSLPRVDGRVSCRKTHEIVLGKLGERGKVFFLPRGLRMKIIDHFSLVTTDKSRVTVYECYPL